MLIKVLFEKILDLVARKTTGIITIVLHKGGIRSARIEKDMMDSE